MTGGRLGPSVWRWALVALAAIVLCSCRSPEPTHGGGPHGTGTLPPGALSRMPEDMSSPWQSGALAAGCPCCSPPLPYQAHGTWSPPGIAGPWPPGEYLCDGGDRDAGVAVSPDWQVYNLNIEDTVAHYDTVDGRTVVEPSNRVCVYAPRFGAVRTVTHIVASEQVDAPGGVITPTRASAGQYVDRPSSSLQNLQARGAVQDRLAHAYQMRLGDGTVSTALKAKAFDNALLPFENLSVIRTGQIHNGEQARLAAGVQAAVTWTRDQGVQVVLDRQQAVAATGDQRAQATFVVEDRRTSKLRVIKVASSPMVNPGDMLDFTIRFDNVGEAPIGNVVILDNLTTRLEYVPGSAQASVDANFSTQANAAGSLVLRWEVSEPLAKGSGGIVRFRCRVR